MPIKLSARYYQKYSCSGIYIEHNDFSGRARYGYDVFNPENPQTDGHGHGTHVAGNQHMHTSLIMANCISVVFKGCLSVKYTGTILGDQYGLAKKATAIAVKALTDFGGGTSAYVFHKC